VTYYRQLAETIQKMEFDHVFILHPDGTVTDAPPIRGYWAPEVVNDPDGDVDMCGYHEWSCITGMTGQYGYSGAVMHPSEYVGDGVARVMAEMSAELPIAFCLTVVTDLDTREGDDNAVGWAICYRDVP
jgi:hypothetical protein